MKVLILAAGYGTRLKEIAEGTPKPLLPINEKPLINYIIDRVKNISGLNEIVVVSNNKFYDQFLGWARELNLEVPVTVVNDGSSSPEDRLGSIGDIQFGIKEASINDELLVVGGDNLFDFDIQAYIEFARSKGEHVSLGAYDIGNIGEASLYGVLALDENKKIISFEEKPQEPKSSLVSMCFYYFPASKLSRLDDYLSRSDKSDRAGDFIRWLTENNDVFGFEFKGTWYDIGSVESYYEAQKNF